jgi:hypothetical protein
MTVAAHSVARRLLLVAMLLLLGAGPAQAAVKPNAAYGGGTPPLSYRTTGNAILVTASANAAGDQVELYAEGFTKCGQGRLEHKAPVAAEGKLTLATTYRDKTEAGEQRTSAWTMTIDFQGNRGTGTAHLDVTFDPRRGKTRKCSKDFAFELRELQDDPPAAPGDPNPGASYFGGTGQGYPFVMRVAADGTKVTTTLFDFVLTCTPKRGRRYKRFTSEISPSGKITDGDFVIRETFKTTYSNGTDRFKASIRGGFVKDAVAGSLTITSTFTDKKTRKVTERCKTGTVLFIAFA